MQKILFNIFFTLWCMKVFRMTLNDRWIFSYEIEKHVYSDCRWNKRFLCLRQFFLYYNNSWVNPLSSQMSACCLLISLCCVCCFSVFPVHEAYSIFQDSPFEKWIHNKIDNQTDCPHELGNKSTLAINTVGPQYWPKPGLSHSDREGHYGSSFAANKACALVCDSSEQGKIKGGELRVRHNLH